MKKKFGCFGRAGGRTDGRARVARKPARKLSTGTRLVGPDGGSGGGGSDVRTRRPTTKRRWGRERRNTRRRGKNTKLGTLKKKIY